MSDRRLPESVKKVLLSEQLWWAFPTPCTYYLNRERVREPDDMPELPMSEWALRERRELLAGSQERMASLEGKGPGLATVNAVVVAAVLLAIASGWDESALLGRLLLAAAAFYAAFSLLMPLYLVGPLPRAVIHVADLTAVAASERSKEEELATRAAQAAMENDLENRRISNMVDAARRELVYALGLLMFWVALVPITELLRR
jgi:hypothetical protein